MIIFQEQTEMMISLEVLVQIILTEARGQIILTAEQVPDTIAGLNISEGDISLANCEKMAR